jgi:hypothetical protein
MMCRNTGQNIMIGRNGSYLTIDIPAYNTPFLVQSSHVGPTESIGVNGTLTPASQNTGVNGNFNLTSYGLGTNVNTTDLNGYWSGFICEVIYYTGTLTVAQRQKLEGYLAWKWGLVSSLPANHPYKTTQVSFSFPFPSVISPSILTVAIPRASTNRPVFAPTQISGCQLWLDAADPQSFTLSGANRTTVSAWNNKVPGGITTTTVSAPSLSGNFSNNIQTFRFNSNSITATLSSAVGTGDYALFALWLTINGGTEGVLSIGPNGGPAAGIGYNGSYYNLYEWGQSESQYVAARNQYVVQSGTRISATKTVYYNGNAAASASGAVNLTNTTLYIGNGTGFPINGEIGEIIMYQGTLTTVQRQQVEGYLAWKWGLISSLPNGHPYKQPPIAPFPYAVRRAVQGSSVSSFSPRSLSGLSLWLDAADPNGSGAVPVDGSAISTWSDKSGNNRTLVTTTAGTGSVRYSTYGGIGSILFNSTSPNTAYMRVVSPVNLTNFSVFVVSRCQGLRSNQNALLAVPLTQHEYNSTDGFGMFIDSDSGSQTDRFYGTTNPNVVLNSNPSGVDAYPLRSMCWTSTENGILRSWFNGNTGNTNSVGVSRTSTATGFGIGFDILGASGTAVNLTCISQFSECIVYSTTLTDSARQQVEGYLAWKWGLVASLPANHPYKLIPPK